jgi:AAA+ ATPase superfamily predicted ATPase
MEFDAEKYKKKLKTIMNYEIDMGLVKNKRQFAQKYGISQNLLISYLKHGNVNIYFVSKLCREHKLTSDYLLYDIKPHSRPPTEFLPPLIFSQEEDK